MMSKLRHIAFAAAAVIALVACGKKEPPAPPPPPPAPAPAPAPTPAPAPAPLGVTLSSVTLGNAVSADRLGILITDLDARFDAHIDHKRLVLQVFPAGLDHATGQLGNNGSQADSF